MEQSNNTRHFRWVRDLGYIVGTVLLIGITWGANTIRMDHLEDQMQLKADKALIEERLKTIDGKLDANKKVLDKVHEFVIKNEDK